MTEQVLTGVGAQLKQAREAAGLAVDEVARQLKLLPRQIESLEHERFERLPGPTIARGMVRSYARLLKLDAEALVARMTPADEAIERGPMTARPREPMPSSSPGQRSTLLYVGFSMVLLALLGAMVYERHREKAAPEAVAAVEPQRMEPAAPTTAAASQAPPAVSEAPPPAVEEKPVEKPVPKPVEKPVEKPAGKPEVAAQPALPPGVHRLVLRMDEEAWIEVRDGAGRELSSLNPAGSERTVRGSPPFRLVIGNAAHVELTYDGKPVDLKPHMRGEVARFTLQ